MWPIFDVPGIGWIAILKESGRTGVPGEGLMPQRVGTGFSPR